MFDFDQTHPVKARTVVLHDREESGGIMANPKNDKHKEYTRFAAHCLEMVTVARDQESRSIQREMAAEWLKLADAILRPSKSVT
jgi:hypothetical protein